MVFVGIIIAESHNHKDDEDRNPYFLKSTTEKMPDVKTPKNNDISDSLTRVIKISFKPDLIERNTWISVVNDNGDFVIITTNEKRSDELRLSTHFNNVVECYSKTDSTYYMYLYSDSEYYKIEEIFTEPETPSL